jgi:hypothetical protein
LVDVAIGETKFRLSLKPFSRGYCEEDSYNRRIQIARTLRTRVQSNRMLKKGEEEEEEEEEGEEKPAVTKRAKLA